jgi:HD-GYP domain-containing protein (c-di-GMP phosphodiesterase class II)
MTSRELTVEERQDIFLDFMKLPSGEPIVNVDTLDYLIKNGFFKKPAAIKYHGNYTGGLFDHSLEVATALVKMTKDLGLSWQNPRSPYIVGMFHDLCKMDDYINENEEYERVPAEWKYNDKKILKGHGDKSIMMLSQLMTLTEEEMLCIRYHMGAYETEGWNEYDRAIKKYETVLWTHTADMYASKVKNI